MPQGPRTEKPEGGDPIVGHDPRRAWRHQTWLVTGGTSAAAPLVAATYALSGAPAPNSTPASFPYTNPTGLSDVTTGSNSSCGTYLCTATASYDGPTGLGTAR